jgi:hypothetical protein
MLIPTAYQRLPSVQGCYNGRLLFGGAVSQMASALAQITRAKALSEAHYYVGRGVLTSAGGRSYLGFGLKGATTYHFIHRANPAASHLGLIFKYISANHRTTAVRADFKLRATAGNSYTGTTLDHGIRFSEVELESSPRTPAVSSTGAELIEAPTNTTPEAPRPLYIPVANRGELLNIELEATQIIPLSVSIYDLFIAEVTP